MTELGETDSHDCLFEIRRVIRTVTWPRSGDRLARQLGRDLKETAAAAASNGIGLTACTAARVEP